MENKMDAALHHIAMSVSDLDKAVIFYRDILGFELDWDMDHRSGEELSKVVGLTDADMHIVMLKGYGFRVELFKYYNPEGTGKASKRQCDFQITHFALSVKNIHQIYQRLLKAGVQFNCPPQDLRPGVCATYMKDPEGNTIELVEYSET